MPALHRTPAETKAHRKKAAEVTLTNYHENLMNLEYAMEALESIGYQPVRLAGCSLASPR